MHTKNYLQTLQKLIGILTFLRFLLCLLYESAVNLGNGVRLALSVGYALRGNRAGQSRAMRGNLPRSITTRGEVRTRHVTTQPSPLACRRMEIPAWIGGRWLHLICL